MSKEFHAASSSETEIDRRLKAIIKASRITTTDRTKFEALCTKFRDTCYEIRKVAEWPDFRGSYDECEIAVDRKDLLENPEWQRLYSKLNVVNLSAKHEGEKLGYTGAEWWLYCWQDELEAILNEPVTSR